MAVRPPALPDAREPRRHGMATYRMVYGDNGTEVTETFQDVADVQREDGWTILFRGTEAFLRVRDEHVRSLERLDS
jgi:hypothetical protein